MGANLYRGFMLTPDSVPKGENLGKDLAWSREPINIGRHLYVTLINSSASASDRTRTSSSRWQKPTVPSLALAAQLKQFAARGKSRWRGVSAMSDPLELFAKVKDAFEHDRLDQLQDGELALVTSNFGTNLDAIPGNREAYRLIAGRLGIDVQVLLGLTAYIDRERYDSFDVRACRRLHYHNWNLPELSEHGPDSTPSSQVKRKYSQVGAAIQLRTEEILRVNREALAEFERFMTSYGLPWPEDVPRPYSRPAATFRTERPSSSHDAIANANATGESQSKRRVSPSRAFYEFRKERLVELGRDDDPLLWNDPQVEAETKRLWMAMSKEEQDARKKKSKARIIERLNKYLADPPREQ